MPYMGHLFKQNILTYVIFWYTKVKKWKKKEKIYIPDKDFCDTFAFWWFYEKLAKQLLFYLRTSAIKFTGNVLNKAEFF